MCKIIIIMFLVVIFIIVGVFGCASSSGTIRATQIGIEHCGCNLICVKKEIKKYNSDINYELYMSLCNDIR